MYAEASEWCTYWSNDLYYTSTSCAQPLLHPRERVWETVHIYHVPMECMTYAQQWPQVCGLSVKLLSWVDVAIVKTKQPVPSSYYRQMGWPGLQNNRSVFILVPVAAAWWSKPWARYVATSVASVNLFYWWSPAKNGRMTEWPAFVYLSILSTL